MKPQHLSKPAIRTGTVASMLCLFSLFFTMPGYSDTVYLVRHAEKQDEGKDPALTACGQARAEALATSMAGIKFAAVYATPYQRTRQTAAPVAKQQQQDVTLYDPRQPELLVEQLNAQTLPALVVGHSNTVPQLVTRLTGIPMAPLTEQDYDLLYQVKLTTPVSVSISRQPFQCQQTE